MMEFNLSEKTFYACSPPNTKECFGRYCLKVEDIKEFIRLLKAETQEWLSIEEFEEWCRKLDRLAGKKLI